MLGFLKTTSKTTLAGLLQFLSVAAYQLQYLFDADATTNPDYGVLVTSFIVLVGLFFAKDATPTAPADGAA